MNLDKWCIWCISCLIMAAISLTLAAVFHGMGPKAARLCAGFNTLPAQEQERYDREWMARDYRNQFLLWAAVMAAGALGSFLFSAYAAVAAWAVWFVLFCRDFHLDARNAFAKYMKS